MSGPGIPLRTLEAWMQAVLVHPGGAESGMSSPGASSLVPAVLAPGLVREAGGLSAADRLDIYGEMYPLRMREALESDAPVLAGLLGPRRFEELVIGYVAAFPSTSFTLARLGDCLPGFLAGWGPRAIRPLLVDVARLELAAARVFDADGPPTVRPIGAAELAAIPSSELARKTFFPVSLEVLRVRPGALRALDAFLEGTELPRRPGRGTEWVLFHRQDFVVLRRALEPFAGRFLERLVAGDCLGRALALASRGARHGLPAPETVSDWFRDWVDLGLLRPDAARGV